MRILLVEDEARLSNFVKKGLVESGYAVDQAFDGMEGLFLAQSENYDAIILDILLPKKNGVDVCRELRNIGKDTPLIMLTAKTKLEDKLTGLEVGADDYLTKPFAFEELKARITALIRRRYKQINTTLTIDTLTLDPHKRTVKREEKEISLTPKEFSILEYLMRHEDEAVTRTQIMEHTWDYNFDSLSNVVDVFIATLRKKIDHGKGVKLIHTVHGVGYKISK